MSSEIKTNTPVITDKQNINKNTENSNDLTVNLKSNSNSKLKVLIITALIVFLFKLYIAATTAGQNDITNWQLFLDVAQKLGIADLYHNFPVIENDYNYYNFPPFFAQALKVVERLKSITNISLGFWIRFFLSLADVGSLFITYKILLQIKGKEQVPIGALILMACAPISIMLSGFHGNIDPFFTFFLLLSVYFIGIDKNTFYSYLPKSIYNYFIKFGLTNLCLAGMVYGLSISIKIVPVMVAPCIFFYLSNNRKRLEFFLAVAFAWIVLASPYIFLIPMEIAHNTLGYKSSFGQWGISRILISILSPNHWFISFYGNQGKFFVLGSIIVATLIMNLWKEKVPIFVQIGVALFIFLSLSPGFIVHYLSWLVPWVVILGTEAALAYYLTSGLLAFMIYNFWSSGFPWNYALGFPYNNFILTYEFICWFIVISICLIYFLYIAKWKKIDIEQYNFVFWINQNSKIITLSILSLISLMAYRDLFIKKGFYIYGIEGNTPEIREKNLFEMSNMLYSRYYIQGKLYPEAINLAQKVLETNPKSADAYNNICVAYASMKEWEKAVEAGKKAVEINPNYQLAQNNLNWVKSQLAATGKISSEPADIVSYLKTPPANFTAGNFINMSLELIQKGDNCNAIVACEKAIELEPNNSIAYNNMCIAYNNLLMFDEAESAGKKALELNPQFELAKNNYNFTLSRKNDPNAPKLTVDTLINLSLAFYNAKMFDKSILFAKKALEIQPNNPIVYNNLCVSYIGANKIDEAISAGEMAIKLDPNSFLAKANLDWAKSLKK